MNAVKWAAWRSRLVRILVARRRLLLALLAGFVLHPSPRTSWRPSTSPPPCGWPCGPTSTPLYYAFVIGCAAQTADVMTTSRAMRPISLMHGIVAFAFNTAIVALAFNVGAGLLAS